MLWVSFSMLFGYLEEGFGGLGGSWGRVGISMDSGTLPGTTQIRSIKAEGG